MQNARYITNLTILTTSLSFLFNRLCTWNMHAGTPEVKQLACRFRSSRFGLPAGDHPKQKIRTGVVVSKAMY